MAELHNPKVIGDMTLTRAPSAPDHPVRLQDLEARVQLAKSFITDITPTSEGIVALKTYAATIPANQVLLSAIADTNNVRVHVLVKGDVFTAPETKVNDIPVENFTAQGGELFKGYVDLVMAETGDVVSVVTGGQTTTVRLTIATEGPVVQTAVIGALPGTQTEAKSGDVIAITGVVANEAVSMRVVDSGAASSGTISTFGADDSAGAGFKTFSGTFTVSGRTGVQAVTVAATNQLGTEGEVAVSSNTITLNQTAPTIGAISVNYPNGQTALRNGDTAQVSSTITNSDSVSYSFSAAGQDATIADADVYAVSKSVTLNSGTYNVANNYTITARKASNGAVSTRTGSIRIANQAAVGTISVLNNPARLRSSAAGTQYTLRVQANQLLSGNPEITLSAGEFSGEWTFGGGVYSRNFIVRDSDPRGDLVASGTVSNIGLVESSASQTFQIGGLVERTIVFPAFARYAAIGANVVDINKTRARYAGQGTDLNRRLDTTDVPASFTIVDENGLFNPNGGYLFISDAAFAGSNTSGTLQLTFEETV